MKKTTLLVRRDQLAASRIDAREDVALAAGQVRFQVDSFALTANNITYAAFGDAMNYWQFFPSPEEGWGIVPAWGFGTVLESRVPDLAVGEQIYGYWPMASHAVLQPERISARGFDDGAPHRKTLHPVYNHYSRCSIDLLHQDATPDIEALLRPLYFTSWLIDDFLAEHAFFGAAAVLLSSASSKTAFATAFTLAQRGAVEVVGLTSSANAAFCESLGCYDRVLTYEQLEMLPADLACVYVDMAGNAALRRRIHERFSRLRYSCAVGGAHVRELGGARDLPAPRAMRFFAPAQAARRQAKWGPDEFERRLATSWKSFTERVTGANPPWLNVQHHRGPEAVQSAYAQVLAGAGDPRVGHMLSLCA